MGTSIDKKIQILIISIIISPIMISCTNATIVENLDNTGQKEGEVTYLHEGVSSVINERRRDAKKKMRSYCFPNDYRIISTRTGYEGFGRHVYIKFACDGQPESSTTRSASNRNNSCKRGNLYDGYCSYTFKNGNYYVGNWKSRKPDGYGTLILTDGSKYTGNWKNGMTNGHGRYLYPNGLVYEGNFKDNHTEGNGTVTTASGFVCSGKWSWESGYGIGMIKYPNGDRYEGEWSVPKKLKNSFVAKLEKPENLLRKHGKGILYLSNGSIKQGHWENDILIKTSEQDVSILPLKKALDKAATYFNKALQDRINKNQIVLGVENFFSQKRDTYAQTIETELYFAFQRSNPKMKLTLLSESMVGVASKDTVLIRCSYEQQRGMILLRFHALEGIIEGKVLAQTTVYAKPDKIRKDTLVAILDIEAKSLNAEQRKAFSDLFRSRFINNDDLQVASSADVDRLNVDAIQRSTGCSRDECATIIGEQLGVDRVIATTIFEVENGLFFISSKLTDISDGTIKSSQSVEYKGDIQTLKSALYKLSDKILTGIK